MIQLTRLPLRYGLLLNKNEESNANFPLSIQVPDLSIVERNVIMEITLTIDENFIIPLTRFNDLNYIEKRVQLATEIDRGALRTNLKYLYIYLMAPVNLPRSRFKVSKNYLEEREIVLTRWLITRTNGKLRLEYGKEALICARKARYRCEKCGLPDIRTLHLDHVEKHVLGPLFPVCVQTTTISGLVRRIGATKKGTKRRV